MKRHIQYITALMLALILLFSLLPTIILAATDTVTLNDIANKQPGDSVVIAGSTTFTEVTVKVYSPNQTMLYIHVLQGPTFNDSFTLPTNTPTGTYTVIIGRDNVVAVETFEVQERIAPPVNSGSGPNSTINPPESTANNDIDKPKITVVNGKVIIVFPKFKANQPDKVTVEVSGSLLQEGLAAALADPKGIKSLEVRLPEVQGAKAYELILPSTYISAPSLTHRIEVSTSLAKVVLSSNMFSASSLENANDNTAASKMTLRIASVDPATLDAALQAEIGNKPIISVTMLMGERETPWNNPSAPVTISIPYIPTPAELLDPERITVWYIDNSGVAIPVPSAKYDPDKRMVTFTVTHFSSFAVVFVIKSFNDLGSFPWARHAIEVMASKGIIKGTSATTYHPGTNVTRADFVLLLVKTLGLTSEVSSQFADVHPTAYYDNAVGIAKSLGITSGTGNNEFKPTAFITRQDMMTLIVKAMSVAGKPILAGDNADLIPFSDHAQIAMYAQESIAALVKSGLVAGDGKSVYPLANASRAETAKLLYLLYNL